MKRVFIIFIVLCYLGSLQGGILYFHYCGGDFKYIAINSTEEKPSCCQGEMEEEDGCCTNEQVSIDIDEHQQYLEAPHSVTQLEFPLLTYSEYLVPQIVPPVFKVYGVSHSPPFKGASPLYILHCVFLI